MAGPRNTLFIGRAIRAAVASALMAAFWPGQGLAQEPWDAAPFSSDPAVLLERAGTLAAPDGPGVVVLFEDLRVVVDSSNRVTRSHRLVYRVGGRPPEEWSSIAAAWEPWYQDRPSVRARVVTPDGAVRELDPGTIVEVPLSAAGLETFSDSRLLRAPLPSLSPGTVVEVETVQQDSRAVFDQGISGLDTFGQSVPVLRTVYSLEVPDSLPFDYEVRGFSGADPVEASAPGSVRLALDIGRLEPFDSFDPFAPFDEPQLPFVAFSTGGSWDQIAAAYGALVDERISQSEVGPLVEEIVRGAESRDEVIGRLLDYVQRRIRYTAVLLGEAAIIPTPPDETLALGYGDCKDQAALLIAMLRSAGFEAYMALLRTGFGPEVEPGTPGFGMFDHAIVYLPGDTPIWVDPTVGFSRLGQLPQPDQGRLALITRPGTAGLVPVPEFVSEGFNSVEVHVAEEGPGRVLMTSEVRGTAEVQTRYQYSQMSSEQIADGLQLTAGALYRASEVRNVEVPDPEDLSRPFETRFEAVDAGLVQTSGNEATVAIVTSQLVGELLLAAEMHRQWLDDQEDRAASEADFVFPEAFVNESVYTILPPPGFEPGDLPEDRVQTFGPASFSQDIRVTDEGAINVALRFDSGGRRYSPAELGDLRSALQRFQPYLLFTFDNVGETHLAAGEIGEALAEFRRLQELHPTEALHHDQAARALMAGSMGEAAVVEARQAVELEPDSASAHSTLARMLERDPVGQFLGPGARRQETITEYERSIELDPDQYYAREALASVLAHNAEGEAYGPGADLDAAIDHYLKIVDHPEATEEMRKDLATALMWSGRFEEMKSFAPRASTLYLAAVAVTDGPEAAAQEAMGFFRDSNTRNGEIFRTADQLARVGKYAEASMLLRVGIDDSESFFMSQADLFDRMQENEALTLPDSDPETVVRKLIEAGVPGREDTFDELLGESLRGIVTGHDLPYMLIRSGNRRDAEYFAADTLARLQTETTGDDEKGYRVRLSAPNTLTTYVAMEDSEYRVVGLGRAPEQLGLEALRRSDDGDLVGAALWLDWALEALAPPVSTTPSPVPPPLSGLLGNRAPRVATPGPAVEDPLAPPYLARFWDSGTSPDPARVRLAAASLLVSSRFASRALPILEASLASPERSGDTLSLELGLLEAYLRLGQFERALPLAVSLVESHPESPYVFYAHVQALSGLGRNDEAIDLLAERLAGSPGDPGAVRALAALEAANGNHARADELYGELISLRQSTADDLKDKAWNSLFYRSTTPQDVEDALEATRATFNPVTGEIILRQRTAAAVLAEAGRTREAQNMILSSLASNERTIAPEDWYVFGRIYEQFGEVEAAVEAYRRVSEPSGDPTMSAWELTRRRLEALGR